MGSLQSLLSDLPGSASSTRLTKILYFAAVICCWAYVSITGHSLADIPTGVQILSGLVLGAGVGQKAIESRQQAAATPTEAPK